MLIEGHRRIAEPFQPLLPSPAILERMVRRPLDGVHIGVLHGLRPVLPGESGKGLSLENLRDWNLDP